MLLNNICNTSIYSIYIYSIYSIVYKKKKEESKEERRNIGLFFQASILGFLGCGNRVILPQIVKWGLFHSCSFKVITMENQTIMTHKEKVEETTIESIMHKNATVSKKQLIAMCKLGQFRKELVQEFIDYCIADIESKKAK